MTFFDQNPTRMQNKHRAIRKRIFLFGRMGDSCPCDICQKEPATDMHEIINKDRVYDPEIRLLTEVPELCSLLCQNCHANKAPGMKDYLFERNISIYGETRVFEALSKIPPNFRRGVYF